MGEVKLLGAWLSPFTYRVIWALKLKGIPYEFIQEDPLNKSPLLLQYIPVYKKIPVLVHNGKPICESMTIIEYLDETWPDKPLLPGDPYERALARFWIKFIEDKGLPIWMIFGTRGEEQEKAVNESLEILETIEEHAKGSEKKYFRGDETGAVDIAVCNIAHWLGVIEEVVGIKVIEPHKYPILYEWTIKITKEPIIKENLPHRDEMLAALKRRREMILASAS